MLAKLARSEAEPSEVEALACARAGLQMPEFATLRSL
jgi:hypothetical protein